MFDQRCDLQGEVVSVGIKPPPPSVCPALRLRATTDSRLAPFAALCDRSSVRSTACRRSFWRVFRRSPIYETTRISITQPRLGCALLYSEVEQETRRQRRYTLKRVIQAERVTICIHHPQSEALSLSEHPSACRHASRNIAQ